MSGLSSEIPTSRWYVWAYPGCPRRIVFSFDVIEQMRAEILRTGGAGRECGGLLIGSKRSAAGEVKIIDFVPTPSASKLSDPSFQMCSKAWAEVVARCPSDSRIVGYYRSDATQNVHLRPDDLEWIQQSFQSGDNVFLVVAASDDGGLTAGFFYWKNHSIVTKSSLTFPFSTMDLASGGWPIREESNHSGIERLPG